VCFGLKGVPLQTRSSTSKYVFSALGAAVLMAAVAAIPAAVAAMPVLAQQPGPTTLTATGVLVGPEEGNEPDLAS
jgi:hypothetical protein